MSMKQMALRHAGACRECGVELPAKATAVYDFAAKNVICLACGGDAVGRDGSGSGPSEHTTARTVTRRGHDRRVGERRRSADAN